MCWMMLQDLQMMGNEAVKGITSWFNREQCQQDTGSTVVEEVISAIDDHLVFPVQGCLHSINPNASLLQFAREL